MGHMMKAEASLWLILTLTLTLGSCISMPLASEIPTEGKGTPPAPILQSETPEAFPISSGEDVMAALSVDSLLSYVEALSEIQPYSGWRNSATSGEQEAVSYVARVLNSFSNLKEMGMAVEQENFRVFMATEVWQAGLQMNVDGQEHSISVNPPRGPRDDTEAAVSFDSDGQLGDEESNPLVVSGRALLVSTENGLWSLSANEAKDRIVFVDYALVDRAVLGSSEAGRRAARLIQAEPMALVLVTSWSPNPGESHGSFAYEGVPFDQVNDNGTPIVVARLEDMAGARIEDMGDLERVSEATVLVDTDVISPAQSRNLIAMIPGRDKSQALILGAHIDSPNNPGAMDDGSGSAILLEIARVLNETSYQPGVTTYLVWFGSEELFLYGSNAFAARHQELLDQTAAMLQIDCLTRPLDGLTGVTAFTYWSYARYGEASYPFKDFLEREAANLGILAYGEDELSVVSDNSSFSGFDVPNADLIYWVMEEAEAGGIHNAGVIHAPYDTLERVKEQTDAFMEMARMALRTVVGLGEARPDLRPTRPHERRAVFVGTQTEPINMSPSALTDFAMAFEFSGLDVDLIPYGATLSAHDLERANVVFALPTIDYPSREAGSLACYDVAWAEGEVEMLREYVEGGGLLVVINSRYRLKYGYPPLDENEDWVDMNALAQCFGVAFHDATTRSEWASPGDHRLVQGLQDVSLVESNAVLFTYEAGATLADVDGDAVMALVPYGEAGGEVLVVGDLGILRAGWGEGMPHNLQLWLNLAEYARER